MQICYSNRIFNWVKNRFIDLSTPADIEFNVHQHSMCLQRIEGNEFPRKEPRRVSKKEKMRLDFGGSLEYGFLRCTPRRDNERCKGEQEQIAPIYDWKIYALLTFIFTRREPDSLSGVESLRSMRNVNERNHLFSVLVIFAHFSPEFDRFSTMNRRRSLQTIDKWKRFWRFDAPWLAPERKLQVLFVLSFVDVFGLCRRCEERWKCRAWIAFHHNHNPACTQDKFRLNKLFIFKRTPYLGVHREERRGAQIPLEFTSSWFTTVNIEASFYVLDCYVNICDALFSSDW